MGLKEQLQRDKDKMPVQLQKVINDNTLEDDIDDKELGTNQYWDIHRGVLARGGLSIALRFKNGKCKTIQYSWSIDFDFDANEGILINMTDKLVRIQGRNLDKIYPHFGRHKVAYIQECINANEELISPEKEVFVKSIEVKYKPGYETTWDSIA